MLYNGKHQNIDNERWFLISVYIRNSLKSAVIKKEWVEFLV